MILQPLFNTPAIHFSETGAMMTRYNRDLEAGVTSNDVTLDAAVDGYQHNFTLHYIIACDVITPVTMAIFGFGI